MKRVGLCTAVLLLSVSFTMAHLSASTLDVSGRLQDTSCVNHGDIKIVGDAVVEDGDSVLCVATEGEVHIESVVIEQGANFRAATDNSPAETRSLVFSPNSQTKVFDGVSYPDDMPVTNMPRLKNCTPDQKLNVRQAWRRAHYNIWRADQVMDWLSQHGDERAAAWRFEYDEDFGSREDGFTNYAPRGWFGSYDSGRFHDIRNAISKLERDRFRERNITVICRVEKTVAGGHSCFTKDSLGGQHAVLGRISLCDNFFEPGRSTAHNARLINHEVAHWLKIPKSGFWLTDNHDYWDGPRCVLDYKGSKPLYHNLAAHIANVRGCNGKNYNRAARNIDNYAYFASQLGKAVYDGNLTEFPRETFWAR